MNEWETFCDQSYYDLWRVRRKNERGFNDGYHIHNGEEARVLVELLNDLERERDAERALAEQRGRLYDTAIGQLKKLQAQVDELNDKIRYNEVESSHNWRNRERDREAITAWKEARSE